MPIIRSTHQGPDRMTTTELLSATKRQYTHIERVDALALQCKELRKDPKKGMTAGGTMQLVARIPELAFFSRPHLCDPDGRINRKELKKFLESPEGEMFKATEARI